MSVQKILKTLEELYPNPQTQLEFATPFQLLIATMLSAQCTDRRVNQITRELFARYPTVWDLAKLTAEEIEPLIHSAGLGPTKARNIAATCQQLIERFAGEVPQTLAELTTLPGVGRKTANVVLSNAFGQPALAVDTHVKRVANRLGLADADNPLRIEEQLMKLIPREKWSQAHHWLILHGRETCHARRPNCPACALRPWCPISLDAHCEKDQKSQSND